LPAQKPTPPPTSASASDPHGFGGVSHGYAPDGPPSTPPPVPLEDIVRDLVDDAKQTVQAELALLEARGALASHGVKWASAWGFVAACALLVALLAVAFGAILVLAPHVGPLLATLIVVAALIGLAGFAGWRAKRSAGDVKLALRSDLSPQGSDD
jgi:hypothetical protein